MCSLLICIPHLFTTHKNYENIRFTVEPVKMLHDVFLREKVCLLHHVSEKLCWADMLLKIKSEAFHYKP
jgi:hypothetical protein